MTLSVPSFFAAVTSASIPPTPFASVAVAALFPPLPPLPPDPPPLEPQAVRASPAVTATTAACRVLRRTSPPGCGACPRSLMPLGRAAWPILTDNAPTWEVTRHERDLTNG